MDERVFVSLGILKVAACLEQAGHPVEMVDLSGIQNFEDCMRDHAGQSPCSTFGITATTPQMPAVMKIATAIRATRPDVRIILGGPHVTLVNAALKRERKIGAQGRATRAFAKLLEAFDVLVCGDGEDAIFAAIVPEPEKVIDADDPKSALWMTNDRLNELPFPARHLVDMSSYHYTIEGERSLSLIAQLGCPFCCTFCGGRESPMLRRIRTRTTENIIKEVLHLHQDYGARGFMFYDDELNVNPSMIELMHGLRFAQDLAQGEFKMRGFIKSQLFTDEQADAMYGAGFRWILVGFESGSERILTNIKKKANRAENTRCMEIAKRHGLKVKALMSVGHAGESEETIEETRQWLLEVKPDDFDATVISVYAGTPYHDFARETKPNIWTYTSENGDRLHSFEMDYSEDAGYYKGKIGEYQSYVFTDFLSPERLVELRDNLETSVREKLGIPFNQSAASIQYEHSMGQPGNLPRHILRRSA